MGQQESISVVYEALWDAKSDQTVYDAVERIAKRVNEILSNAVNFGAAADGLAKLSESFAKVAQKAEAIEKAVNGATEATKKQKSSAETLLALYNKLNAEAQKATNSGAYSLDKELRTREAMLRVIKAMQQSGENFAGFNMAEEYNKSFAIVQRLREQLSRAGQANRDIAVETKEHFTQSVRYAKELAEIEARIRRFSDPTLGRSGIEQQIKEYENMRKVYSRMLSDNILKDDPGGSKLLNETYAKLESLKSLKSALADLDRANGVTAAESSARQSAALEKLSQKYGQLRAQMEGTTGKSAAADQARLNIWKQMQAVLLKRIELGDKDAEGLAKEWEALRAGKYVVEQLSAAFAKLKAEISQPVKDGGLSEYSRQLERIKQARATLTSMSGFQTGDLNITKEMDQLAVLERKAREEMAAFSGNISDADKNAKKLRESIEQALRSYAIAVKDFASGKDMAGVPGLELQLKALKDQDRALTQLRDNGKITHEQYIQGWEVTRNTINEVTTALADLKSAQKNLTAAGAGAPAGQAELIAKLKAEYDRLDEAIKRLSNTESDAVLKRNLMKDQLAIISKLMKQQGVDLDDLRAKHDQLIKEYARIDSQVSGVLRKWGRSFADLIKYQMEWYAGTTLILGGMFTFADQMRKAFDFTQAIKDAGAIVGATSAEMNKISEAAIRIGETTTLGALEAAEALKILGQTGLDADQSIAALEVTARLMTATGAQVEEVVKGMTTAMQVWDYSTSELGDVGNIMAATMNASKLEMKDLQTIFNYLASTSEQVGYSLEETSAAMAVLSNRGVSASTIGTGLSNVFSSLVAPTTRAAKVMKEFGIGLDEISPYSHKFADIIERLTSSGMQVSDIFRAFNKREARILATAMNAGADAFRNMEGRVKDTNAALEVYAESMEGAKNQFILLGNELSNIFNNSIGKMGPELGAFAKILRTTVITMKDATPALVAVNAAILALRAGATGATLSISGLTAAMTRLVASLGPWGALAATLSAATIAYQVFHKTSEEHIADLKDQSDAALVAMERSRQQKAAFTDYLATAQKNKDNDQAILDLKKKIIAQYPEMLEYLKRESTGANANATEYDKLTSALNAFIEAKNKESKQSASSYFKEQGEMLREYRKEMEALQAAQKPLQEKGIKDRPTTNDMYTGGLLEWMGLYDPTKEVDEYQIKINEQANKIVDTTKGMADKIKSMASSGMTRSEIMQMMTDNLPTAEDVDRAMSFYDDMVAKAQKKGGEVRDSVDRSIDGIKKSIKTLNEAYDSTSQSRQNYYDMTLKQIQEMGRTEAETAQASIMVQKMKAADAIEIATQQALQQRKMLEQIADDDGGKQREIHAVEQEYAKKKEAIWKELQSSLKEIAKGTVDEIDGYYASSVERYDAKMQETMSQMDWDLSKKMNAAAGKDKADEVIKAEKKYQSDSLQLTRDATRRKIQLAKDEAKAKIGAMVGIVGDERKVHTEIVNITKASIDKQIDYYGKLKEKMISAYEAALDKANSLREQAKDLRDSVKELLNTDREQFGSSDSPQTTVETAKRVAYKAQMLIQKGTESGFDEGIGKLEKALEALKGIDMGTEGMSDALQTEVLKLIDSDTKLLAYTKSRYADYKEKLAKDQEAIAAARKQEADAAAQREDELRKQKAALDQPDPKAPPVDPAAIRAQLIESLKDVPVVLTPEMKMDQLKAELAGTLLSIQVAPYLDHNKPVDIPDGLEPKIRTIPTVDDEGIKNLREEFNGLTTTSQHEVNMSNRDAVGEFLDSIKQPIVTEWTIIKKVVGGSEAPTRSDSDQQSDAETFATGGWLAGYGGGDRIRALLEAGEYVIRKEAVRFYGKDLIDAINHMRVPRERRYAEGGHVAPIQASGKQDMIIARIQLDDMDYPIEIARSSKDAFEGFVDRLDKEKLSRRKRVRS